MRSYTLHQQLVSVSCESLFPHRMIFNTKWMSEWMNEWMNEWTNGRTDERGREWMNEWTSERSSEREREREIVRASKRTNEQVREGGSVWVISWVLVSVFIGGYKVDFSKFKRCSTFNYCTAIQTNKQRWSKYVLIGISVNRYINNYYH